MATAISKSAQVLKYFAQQYGAPPSRAGIPRKRLVKMAYLSDLLAREYLGRAITEFSYYRYKHGPYDRAIVSTIDELVKAGLAEDRQVWDGDYRKKLLLDTGVALAFDFSAGEMEILRYVANTYLRMPMEELLEDVVYPSSPMRQTSRMEEVLPMDSVNNRGAREVGFDLEAVLRAEQEIDAGRFKTAIL